MHASVNRPGGEILLTAEEISHFQRDGFLVLPMISNPRELQMLNKTFERLFAVRAGRREGNHFDLLGQDRDEDLPVLPSIINPVNYATELRELAYRRNAYSIAKQLLGDHVTPAFEHVILKPPLEGPPTPWHQDEAYRVDAGFAYKQISFWMPLRDANLDNGCMHYIPGSHLGPVLPHQSYNNDPKIHAIECVGGFDATKAIACPLPAGGAVIHDGRTFHHAGPNRTNSARCAYILAFELPPKLLIKPRDFFWNQFKQTRGQLRRSRWRRHGGIAIEGIRKYRLGMFASPARFLFELRRALRALWKLLKR